ncbi:MAG TPA: histidine kinase, partial [Jatrophihabitans sp.]|nr:histidine kinase [Jatrophihabitans sp.]
MSESQQRRKLSAIEIVGDTTSRVDNWRQLVFPAVFLIYLVQTGAGVLKHARGVGVLIGMALIAVFCACYLSAMVVGRNNSAPRLFWWLYVGMLATTAVETVFARGDAFVMLVYVAVMTVAALWYRGLPVIALYAVIAVLVPDWLWHDQSGGSTAVAIGIIALAMYGFFAVLRSNAALAAARTEVARLATENERARIARDLHDLLGHSLTTISVKAQLAHRLSATDPARAASEIAEVEELTRRTLTDVRAAVSGYREVTLGNELAAAREVLRAAGISARLPGA